MERLNGFCLTVAVLALGLASLPAAAQQTTTKQTTTTTTTTTQMTQDRISTMRNDMVWDRTIPASPAQDKLVLLQMMADKGFTKSDLLKIVPLLEDLRDYENLYMFGMEDTASYWATMPHQSKYNGIDSARTAATIYRDKRDKVWNTITADIGADKASVLRGMVEPTQIDVGTYAYTDTHLQRIDQLIHDWDRLAAERVAANGGTAPGTASTVSVETTTTTTTATIPGIEVWSFPALTTADLVDVTEMRLAALEAEGNPEAVLAIRGHELNSPTMTWLREKRLKYWE